MQKVVYILQISLVLLNCSKTTEPPPSNEGPRGAAAIQIVLGKVGVLKKISDGSAELSLDSILIILSKDGEEKIKEKHNLFGIDKQVFHTTYDKLDTGSWHVAVNTTDNSEKIIHKGEKSFKVTPDETVDVELNLTPEFSIVKARFPKAEAGFTDYVLLIDGTEVKRIAADPLKSEQTVIYNYLPVSSTGTDKEITMNIYGNSSSGEVLLYSGSQTITCKSSENQTIKITLLPIESGKTGGAKLNINIGAIGTIQINGELADSDTPDPPLAYWKFEDCAGDKVLDEITGNHYALHLTDAACESGHDGNSLVFDSETDVAVLDNVEKLDIPGNMAIALWIKVAKPASELDWYEVITRRELFKTNYGINIKNEDGSIQFIQWYFSDGDTFFNALTTVSINYDTWYHLAVTREISATSTDLKIYLDGALVQQKTWPFLPASFLDVPFKIGQNNDQDGDFCNFYGAMDEIKIFDRVLTASEVSALAQ